MRTTTQISNFDELTPAERTRVNYGILLQALRECFHASLGRRHMTPARTAEIDALLESSENKDPELCNALAQIVAKNRGDLQAVSAEAEQAICRLAATDNGIEATLINDENSTDDELVEHFVDAYGMRAIEATEHVKRRSYLLRYAV